MMPREIVLYSLLIFKIEQRHVLVHCAIYFCRHDRAIVRAEDDVDSRHEIVQKMSKILATARNRTYLTVSLTVFNDFTSDTFRGS